MDNSVPAYHEVDRINPPAQADDLCQLQRAANVPYKIVIKVRNPSLNSIFECIYPHAATEDTKTSTSVHTSAASNHVPTKPSGTKRASNATSERSMVLKLTTTRAHSALANAISAGSIASTTFSSTRNAYTVYSHLLRRLVSTLRTDL